MCCLLGVLCPLNGILASFGLLVWSSWLFKTLRRKTFSRSQSLQNHIPSFSFLSELKIYHLSFLMNTHGAFDIAEPSSMQDACYNELSKYDLARHDSPISSVVRAPDRCTGGHGFDSRRGLRFFSLSRTRDN